MSRICRFLSCLMAIFLCFLPANTVFSGSAAPAYAATAQPESESWEALISGHPISPPYMVVVDKSRQQLSFFERRSPMKLSRVFFSTTGQAVGAKEVEGDLKTPEGVYFVVHRIGAGLDFVRFGNEAYTLNYPNPVDRLRRKTGHGIWIHGRGEPLTPLQTEGCVALDNDELGLLGRFLTVGTPVVLTESFTFSPEGCKEQAAVANELYQKVKGWAAAWSARSATYFDFYNKEAYSIAQREPFSAFQSNKERLFKFLPWIRTTASDIQVLQGPGYWVTWFFQDYQAPNLNTRGVRRLYWAEDDKGELKIVGMEWRPGLSTSATLVASSGPLLPPLETGLPAVIPDGWIVAAADTPGSYGVAAAEGRLPAHTPASTVLAATSSPVVDVPAELARVLETPDITASDTDVDAVLLAAQLPSEPDAAMATPTDATVEEFLPNDEDIASQIIATVQSWRVAWEQGDLEAYMAYYVPRARQDSRKNAGAIKKQKETLWKRLKPASVLLEDMRVTVEADTAQVVMRQTYTNEKGSGDIGRKTLSLILKDGAWLITQEDWSALPNETGN